MKTRKVLQAVTAAALIAAMAVPTSAFAETFTGSQVDEPQSGNTEVTMSVEAQYTVTIPSTIVLTDSDHDTVYTGDGSVKVENVHLASGKKLQITVSDNASPDDGFFLRADNGTNYPDMVQYYIGNDAGVTAPFSDGGVAITCSSNTGYPSASDYTLYFKTNPVTVAGDYSGTVTFGFSTVDASTAEPGD